ncbi:serine/threonine-protein kinase Nek9-like [Watersipora subatra]|uniref:serine/threonine-protein kinase Nek9-like n=1 Tax=Watersipora subatra TaxID=2589382 RepID=UPI00355C5960
MSSEPKSLLSKGDESPTEVTYIPIRVLGKGAFGEATLYRRVEDNSLVVWKEVNLSRLSDKETSDSANEVDILSLLDHPNIITYYNHFVDSSTLLIEMEYANDGNLYQKISRFNERLEEEMVIWYFYQLISAVAFIHDLGIIHRDIKSLNIFLTKGGLCKVGDFGISKVMTSKTQMAESYVGTPYYMSPELIKGEAYNFKSDIWACGCILYELCTRQRVFEATNALRLAAVIVQAEFSPIDGSYSDSLRSMLTHILNKDPAQRPSASQLFEYDCMQQRAAKITEQVWKLNASNRQTRLSSMAVESQPIVLAQSTEVYVWGGGKVTPRKLEEFKDAKSAAQISCSKNHYAVITVEKELYTWTNAYGTMAGQLGHGDTAAYRNPKKVEVFDGIPLKQVACGEEFTVCLADDGSLYSFGGDYYGCLAQESEQVVTPAPITHFEYTISQVSAGDCHVVALTSCGKLFTWGCGEFGRLGNGCEDDATEPLQISLPIKQDIKSVLAGSDCTFLITASGKVLACGNNEHNKLGLNNEVRGIVKRKAKVCYDTPCQYTLVTVKPLRNNSIVQISSGPSHTAAVTNYGQLLTFGCNKYGQLGLGDFKDHPGINLVSGVLAGRKVTRVSCGDNFTVIATNDNQVFACGSCQDGRLGIAVCTQNVALPRPIFGSLHAVSSICSSYWGTILVADKLLGQKTISKTSSNKSLIQRGVEEIANDDDQDCVPGINDTSLMMSSTPAWVKEEFREADNVANMPVFSPLKLNLNEDTNAVPPLALQEEACTMPGEEEFNNNDPIDTQTTVHRLTGKIADMESSCMELTSKLAALQNVNLTLEATNATLRSDVSKKNKTISLLVARLQKVDSEFDSWSSSQQLV